jgi:hypothetical protein
MRTKLGKRYIDPSQLPAYTLTLISITGDIYCRTFFQREKAKKKIASSG